MSEPEQIKVVLLGSSGVGKTSIIKQFINKSFDPHQSTSLSAKFLSKVIEFPEINKSIKFDIWDTVGQEKYHSLAKIFYKNAKIIILVYDVTNVDSYKEITEFWYKETKDNADGNAIYAVVANKIDLFESQKVKNEEGKEFADGIKAIFQATSALSDTGILTLFENLGKTYLIPNYNYQSDDKKAQEEYLKKQKNGKKDASNNGKKDNNIKLDEAKTTKKRGCC
jgi:small GTP-binding protein